MSDYKELVKALRNCAWSNDISGHKGTCENLRAAADTIEQLVKELMNDRHRYEKGYADATPKWISVNDALPETIACAAGTSYSEAVIVLTSGRKVVEAVFDGIDFIGPFDYWECQGEEVTHWMPVLELPKEASE